MSPLSYDFNGKQISDVTRVEGLIYNIWVSIFPESERSYILISWLSSQKEHFASFKEQFEGLRKSEAKFLNAMSNMVICHSNNFAISPRMIVSWDNRAKDRALKQFTSNAVNHKLWGNVSLQIEKGMIEYPCPVDLFVHI